MFVNQRLVAEANLPIRLLLTKSLYGFVSLDKVSHVKVEGVEHIIIRNATFHNVINIVRLVAPAREKLISGCSMRLSDV